MRKLTYYQVAQKLEIHVSTLYNWLAKGWMIRPKRFGGRVYWSEEELNEWIAAGHPRPCDEEVKDESLT